MSLKEVKLASLIIRETFGDTVEKVCALLLRKPFSPLGIIAQKLGLRISQVKKALCVLIRHNVVTFGYNKKGFVEYSAIIENILARTQFPVCLYSSKTLFGDVAELIIEELLLHGQLQMSEVIDRVHNRLTVALQESNRPAVSVYEIRDQFIKLTQTQFIQRCPCVHDPEDNSAEARALPVFSDDVEEMYVIPNIDFSGAAKRKHSTDSSEQPSKKAKVEKQMSDADIYWRLNSNRFDRYLRDQTLIKTVIRKVDMVAGEIMRTILRQSELVTDANASATNPLSYNEIYQGLPKELNLSRQLVDQYLKILVEDSTEFLLKVGDSGGGMYVVDFKKGYTTLCKAHIMSVVQERFGSKSLRIYRLLMLKKQLEQKQIEEFAMVPAKEAKDILYQMLEEHFVKFTEIPKTPDHAPSRTFYLFSVDVVHVAHMLLERCYKALYNLMLKRNQELTEHKRLLEKQQRMEAVIASLEQSETDEAQRQEIEEMLTPAERNLITKVKSSTKKMELAELQMNGTIFVLRMYLHYVRTAK